MITLMTSLTTLPAFIQGFMPAFFGNIRGTQLLIIVLVVLLLFGGKKIPELMRGLGKGVHSFKQGLEDAKAEINKPVSPGTASDDKSSSATVTSADQPADKPQEPRGKDVDR